MHNTLPTLEEAHQHFKVGKTLQKQSNFLQSISHFEQAKSIFEAHKKWKYFLECHYEIGKCYIRNSTPQKAVEALLLGIKFAKEKDLEQTKEMGDLYLEISSAYIAVEIFEEVEFYLLAAETIYKNLPNTTASTYGYCYMYMGAYYAVKGDVDKSLQHLQNSLKIFQKLEEKEE